MSQRRFVRLVLLLLTCAAPCAAHVGSPELLHEADAGPYHLFVALTPPSTVPGIARVRLRASGEVPRALTLAAAPLGRADTAPRSERAAEDPRDPRAFDADVWIMTPGTWKLAVSADGPRGRGTFALPVPALPSAPAPMSTALALGLAAFTLLLGAGFVAVVGAAAREGSLAPGAPVTEERRRESRRAMVVAGAGFGALALGGAAWWSVTARRQAGFIYRPTRVTAWVDDAGRLFLRLEDSGWLARRPDDLVADHGHLMHAYVLRYPNMDRVLHLHPDLPEPGLFARDLPALPAGRYRVFADIVHQTALAETCVSELELPALPGRPLLGDDAGRELPPVPTAPHAGPIELEDGSRLELVTTAPFTRGAPLALTFRARPPSGGASTLEPYLGMLGHLAVVAHDFSVFTHVHPSGTVPMAAVAAAESNGTVRDCAPEPPPSAPGQRALDRVSFPYAFPHAGNYRLIVQVKRRGRVLTGAFDVSVGV